MAFPNFTIKFLNLLRLGFILLLLLMENTTHARIGYFWHITDLHLDTIYSTQGDVLRSCWHIERQSPSSSTRSPGRFGDYLCDSPWSLIESAAKAMKSRQGDNVEFVLWTGDGLSHSAHPMFEKKKLEILRNLTDLLGRTFTSQFVFPVLGHEDGTTNFRHIRELWQHWLPSEALHTFEKGGYYSIEQTKSRLRIIALNTNFMRHDPKYSQSHLAAVRQRTPSSMGGSSSSSSSSNGGGGGGNGPETPEYKNYYYHHGTLHQQQHHVGHSGDWNAAHGIGGMGVGGYGFNGHGHRGISTIPGGGGGMDGSSSGSDGARVSALSEYENQDTEKQWIWLEDVLSKSKNSKETVYIVGHIPPGSDERHIGLQQNGHTTFTESNNKRYLDLVRKYSSIIQGQFFGHLHSDSFRIIYDDKGKPVSWMMISPSVTPRKMSVGSNNPAMRLYKFDTDSGQVLDYTQYYMDLQLANTLGEPNWVSEYNLTHYYALSDISAISLHNFVDRFTSNDGSWFAKYYRANTVRYQGDPCEGVCMLNHYCAITRVDYKEFRQCLEKEQSALRSQAAMAATLSGGCPLLLLVCALAVSCCRTSVAAVMTKLIIGHSSNRQQQQQQQRQARQRYSSSKQQIKFDVMTMIKISRSTIFSLMLLASSGMLLLLHYMLVVICRITSNSCSNKITLTSSKPTNVIAVKLQSTISVDNADDFCCMQQQQHRSMTGATMQLQTIKEHDFVVATVSGSKSSNRRSYCYNPCFNGMLHPYNYINTKDYHYTTALTTMLMCLCVAVIAAIEQQQQQQIVALATADTFSSICERTHGYGHGRPHLLMLLLLLATKCRQIIFHSIYCVASWIFSNFALKLHAIFISSKAFQCRRRQQQQQQQMCYLH